MPVYRYLDLSTSHLPERESEEICGVGPTSSYAMGYLDRSPRVIAHEYGAWVNVPTFDGGWSLEDNAMLHKKCPNLAACIARARSLDCNWINFDADAGTETGLPTFEW